MNYGALAYAVGLVHAAVVLFVGVEAVTPLGTAQVLVRIVSAPRTSAQL